MANYSFQDPDLPDGSVIESGNFTQLIPETEIMVGNQLIINGGNFVNVKQQPEWIINGGNWRNLAFCSHLHAHLVSHGLPPCAIECSHMIQKDEIEIDGVVVDTIYTYEDTKI